VGSFHTWTRKTKVIITEVETALRALERVKPATKPGGFQGGLDFSGINAKFGKR
jgi:hypothetical protein